MLDRTKIGSLAVILAEARRSGQSLPELTAEFAGLEPADADTVQEATLALLGEVVGGYKVFQVGANPGHLGLIPASHIFAAPTSLAVPSAGRRIELEIAFRFGRDLPGRRDGRRYGADEVAEAVAGAFAAFELLESRLPTDPKPSPIAARADAMGNWGLVRAEPVADWRRLVRADVPVRLMIGDRCEVDQCGGHPSGDPFHPLVWLANALADRGRGLRAGEVVTTGAFGGARLMKAGETAIGSIAGLPSICLHAD